MLFLKDPPALWSAVHRWAVGQGVSQQGERRPLHGLRRVIAGEAGDVDEPDQGLNPDSAAKTMEWSALALLRHALADGPPING